MTRPRRFPQHSSQLSPGPNLTHARDCDTPERPQSTRTTPNTPPHTRWTCPRTHPQAPTGPPPTRRPRANALPVRGGPDQTRHPHAHQDPGSPLGAPRRREDVRRGPAQRGRHPAQTPPSHHEHASERHRDPRPDTPTHPESPTRRATHTHTKAQERTRHPHARKGPDQTRRPHTHEDPGPPLARRVGEKMCGGARRNADSAQHRHPLTPRARLGATPRPPTGHAHTRGVPERTRHPHAHWTRPPTHTRRPRPDAPPAHTRRPRSRRATHTHTDAGANAPAHARAGPDRMRRLHAHQDPGPPLARRVGEKVCGGARRNADGAQHGHPSHSTSTASERRPGTPSPPSRPKPAEDPGVHPARQGPSTTLKETQGLDGVRPGP
ncbi:hypothetical protein SAMN05421869_12186 [Nonomuraea jiangxiensis]|uniref:Uncharacterized protein n=1 Tax=Nonomuraea jiangxiensis TaxID=633440 RepID=A0A1G9GMV1_9ACTN|nr:hypothetical protein SAMN05421869_12186 [Nonomuraea jiangxiensis]